MSFNDNVPKHMTALEDKMDALWRERTYGIDWGHSCDCEYCDMDGEDADPRAEEKAAKIDAQIEEVTASKERLKRYAADHGIEISVKGK